MAEWATCKCRKFLGVGKAAPDFVTGFNGRLANAKSQVAQDSACRAPDASSMHTCQAHTPKMHDTISRKGYSL